MKYVTKPSFIEAIQLTEELAFDCLDNRRLIFNLFSVSGSWHSEDKRLISAYVMIGREYKIREFHDWNREESIRCNLGDWIIKYPVGKFDVMTDSEFNNEYMKVKCDCDLLHTCEQCKV